MIRTSVHMEFIVSMRSWAIRHGKRHFNLPIPQLPTNLHHHTTSCRLPYQDLGKGDRQIGSLASPGETSRHSSHESQEIQDSCEKASRHKNNSKANSAVAASLAIVPSAPTTLNNRYAALLATLAAMNDEE
jgi:hypothetical protein